MSELFRAKVLHNYKPVEEDELALSKGTIVSILESNGQWWRGKNEQGEEGVLPSNYVERIHEETVPAIPPRRPGRAKKVTPPPEIKTRQTSSSRKDRSTSEPSSIVSDIIETPWNFNSSNINMAEPVWRKSGFSELMLDGFYLKDLPNQENNNNTKKKNPHESKLKEFHLLKNSIKLINEFIDALVVGPLSRKIKKIAWDVQGAFRETIQLMDAVLMIPDVDKGPTIEGCYPFVTRVANVVRAMSPGQVHIIPGGWTEPKINKKDQSYYHMVLYVVSRNDDGTNSSNKAGYCFTVCNYAMRSPSTNGYHPKRIAASNLSVQYQTNIIFDTIPDDRIKHTAFWISVLRPLLVPGGDFDFNDGDGNGNVAYERLFPFLNRKSLETSIAESSTCTETWITVSMEKNIFFFFYVFFYILVVTSTT
jgi:hypothetical protein